ncbi:MAG: hypothetical protein LC689_10865 [Myxococcales bacterium]|nr:hypothetical protein [Myxococcales bacterium]
MPVSKKRKPEKKKRRDRDLSPAPAPAAPAEPIGGGGFLSKMRGGFQAVAGAGPKKPESLISKVVTWALVALVAYFVAKRFGILR